MGSLSAAEQGGWGMIEVAFRYMPEQPIRSLSKSGIASARTARPNWSKAFELLRYELARIGAANVVRAPLSLVGEPG